jgi:hypothetical protein
MNIHLNEEETGIKQHPGISSGLSAGLPAHWFMRDFPLCVQAPGG